MSNLTRPIIGIENRTAQEVFDIMCGRIKGASPPDRDAIIERAPSHQWADEHLADFENVKALAERHAGYMKLINRVRAQVIEECAKIAESADINICECSACELKFGVSRRLIASSIRSLTASPVTDREGT